MKPVIAITCDYEYSNKNSKIHEDYYRAISIFGGLPMLLPGNNIEDIENIFNIIDGVLITGGDDVDPSLYGEPPHIKLGNVNPYRDEFELALAQRAIGMGMPVLGICRGAQIMNVAMGGTLYQDIDSQFRETPIAHRQKAPTWYGIHDAIIDRDSILYSIVGQENIRVNSFHHQAVKEVAPGFTAVAHAPDGVVEAIAKDDHPFIVGVQWHPEKMIGKQEHSRHIFERFVISTKLCRV